MIKKRSIGICILLSIITLGIYGIYWFVMLHNEVKIAANDDGKPTAGVAFLLTLVTCGIYGYYWNYKQGEKLDKAYADRGMATSSRAVVYLVLSIFGLSIISYALMQDSLNKLNPEQ